MKLMARLPALLVLAVVLAGLGVVVWRLLGAPSGAVATEIMVPSLSEPAQRGQVAFNANCAGCHGANGAGSDKGPPLIHDIYNPGHHGDVAFVRAARLGTRQHHWPYGDMPAQPQVSDREIEAIIYFVREVQRANGIVYKPHNM
jgi:mono/diheme cytochrome c family protein